MSRENERAELANAVDDALIAVVGLQRRLKEWGKVYAGGDEQLVRFLHYHADDLRRASSAVERVAMSIAATAPQTPKTPQENAAGGKF